MHYPLYNNPTINTIKGCDTIDKQICEYLRRYKGEENTVSAKTIEQAFRLDGAEVRRCIHRLRRKGVPICSDTNGYFYAQNQREIDRTIHSMNSRILKMQSARNGLVKSKQGIPYT